MEPGIYRNLSMEKYSAVQAISRGVLTATAVAPLYAKAVYEKRDEETTTDAQHVGIGFHYAVEDEELFRTRCVKAPRFDRRTKQGKEDYERFHVDYAGKVILPEDDYEQVLAMAKAVRERTTSQKLIKGATTEVSFFWRDKETGELCKGRADALNQEKGILIDFKTSRAVSNFAKVIAESGYDMQLAWYAEGLKACGVDIKHAVCIFVTKTDPVLVCEQRLVDEHLEVAKRANEALLKRFATCKKLNIWPGYPEMVQDAYLPDWRLKSLENCL